MKNMVQMNVSGHSVVVSDTDKQSQVLIDIWPDLDDQKIVRLEMSLVEAHALYGAFGAAIKAAERADEVDLAMRVSEFKQ